MQKPRRRRGLELDLLSLSGILLAACAPAAVPLETKAPERTRSVVATPLPPPASVSPGVSTGSAGAPQPPSTTTAFPAPVPIDPPRKPGDEPVASETHAPTEPPTAELPRGTLILHIGDSFAAALGIPLAKRLKAAGLRNILQFKTASYIPTWAFGPELKKYVADYNPDLVLITLGANEIDLTDPVQRGGAIRRLIAAVNNKPCVWITPPLWKPDTGLLEVIRQNAAPCRYLDSDALVTDLPRGRDKIHPSMEGREIWADAVLAWLIASRDPSGARAWALRPEPEPDASTPRP